MDRGGARKNEIMSIAAAPLKDQDIADLAAYFAAIPVIVGEPRGNRIPGPDTFSLTSACPEPSA